MLKTEEEIENWLKRYEIENFVINDDLTVDVNRSVNLSCREIKEFPFKFGIIRGDFDCSLNELGSLKNSPKKTLGCFDCSSNKLTSLEFCPEEIKGDFYCSHNKLTSLEHCPEEIDGGFYCYNNKLTSLKYCSKKISDGLYFAKNKLTSLEYCPKIINGDLDFSYNKIDKKSLYLFSSDVEGDITSDFGDKEEFLCEVKKQKIIKEKEKLTKIINSTESGQLIKKRL